MQNDNVYKKVELVGSSGESVTEAIDGAIERASKTLNNLSLIHI